jgi:hypothetical protein
MVLCGAGEETITTNAPRQAISDHAQSWLRVSGTPSRSEAMAASEHGDPTDTDNATRRLTLGLVQM